MPPFHQPAKLWQLLDILRQAGDLRQDAHGFPDMVLAQNASGADAGNQAGECCSCRRLVRWAGGPGWRYPGLRHRCPAHHDASGEDQDQSNTGKGQNDRCSVQRGRHAGATLPAGTLIPGLLMEGAPGVRGACGRDGGVNMQHWHRGSDLFRMPGC